VGTVGRFMVAVRVAVGGCRVHDLATVAVAVAVALAVALAVADVVTSIAALVLHGTTSTGTNTIAGTRTRTVAAFRIFGRTGTRGPRPLGLAVIGA